MYIYILLDHRLNATQFLHLQKFFFYIKLYQSIKEEAFSRVVNLYSYLCYTSAGLVAVDRLQIIQAKVVAGLLGDKCVKGKGSFKWPYNCNRL